MNKHKVGLVVGSFLSMWHLIWGILVAVGFAQPLLNFIYNLHSLNNPFMVMPFDFMRTLGLVIVTFVVGYVVGYVFANIWHHIHK